MNLKHLFVPVSENDYTPHLLKRAAMLIMLILVLLSFASTNLQALLWQSSNWLVGTVLPAVVVDLTNKERGELSAQPLVRNAVLDEAARLKAEDMAKYSYFSHYSPDGVSPWHWFEEVSYTYAHAGENLAIHFKDSGALVDAWMKSPTHRANIANTNYTEIGVGTAKGRFEGHDTVFVVQLFGTPAITPVAAAPESVKVSSTPVVVPVAPTPLAVAPITATPQPVNENVAGVGSVSTSSAPIEPVVVTPEVSPLPEPAPTPTPTPLPTPVPVEVEVEVAEIVADDGQISVFSTHFATSSGLEPALINNTSGTTAPQASFIGSIATKPSMVLQVMYLTLGFLLTVVLLLSISLGVRFHRPQEVAYGVALLLIMSGLFYVQSALTTSVAIAADVETAAVFE